AAIEARIRAAIVASVVGIGQPVEVVGHDADVVRPGVGHLCRQAMAIFNSDSGLQRVVVEVGLVFFLVDVGKSREVAIGVGKQRRQVLTWICGIRYLTGYALAHVVWTIGARHPGRSLGFIHERQGIDL